MSGEQLRVTGDRRGGICVVGLRGPLDTTAATVLTERIQAERAEHPARLVIDMSGVSSVDAGAARALAASIRSAEAQCPVVVRSVRPAVRWQLELAGLDISRPDGDATATAALAGSATAALVREWKYLLNSTEHTIAGTRRATRSLASTEDDIAATLLRLAEGRPDAAARLERLSRLARDHATMLRDHGPRDVRPAPAGPVTAVGPGHRLATAAGTVERAVAFIEERAHDDISVADIARAAFVTVRAVQLAFRRYLGTTPLGYLRLVRLERAHRQLLSADPDRTTVTAVAADWYFTNASRFSAYYRAAYGVSPAQTLRRRPAGG